MAKKSPNIDEIFSAAIEFSTPAERAVFVDAACGDDESLKLRVVRLVDAHFQAGEFLASPPFGLPAEDDSGSREQSGTTIGRYKLLEQIGEGGFAIVFMAEQMQPVRRRVALKIIKAGMDTKQVVARFEAERQALAMMDHPSIAKVLDAGATAPAEGAFPGRPYFVMDLVKGEPITEYSDHHQLSIDQRLELFVQVCQAVQHAHQKGVIHRDIKPTNVLVSTQDDRPLAKVIDFGIAKATGTPLTDQTLFTDFRQLIGTPAYMSPEQADGSLDIDTRSDVYSLGVLLYELLAGAPPFDPKELRSKAFAEMQRVIREVEPPTPSTRLSGLDAETQMIRAKQRQIDPLRLDQRVRGELDWIVMRALEKDRNRRYPTANALALDVGRHLADEPVEACPLSATYRLKKFIRRNKVGVLAGLAIATALAAGLAIASVGFVHARRQAERNELVSQFLKDVLAAAGPGIAKGRDATVLREVLDKTADRVEKDLSGDPEVQGDLWFTLGSTFQDIGDYQRAIALLQQAVGSYRRALGEQNSRLARSLGLWGACQSFAKDISGGRANAQLGLDMARKCGDADTLAFCLFCRARSSNWWGMGSEEAVPYLREAIALRRQLGTDPIALADCLRALGTCDAVPPAETYESTCEALEIYRQQLGTEHPRYATAVFLQGQLLIKRQKFVEAEKVLRDTLALWQKIYDSSHPYRPIVHRILAESLALQGRWQEADAMLRESPTEVETLAGNYNIFFTELTDLLKVWGTIDETWVEAENTFNSRPLAELQASPTIPNRILSQLGFQHVRRQQWPQAVAAFVRLVEIQPAEPLNYHALGALLVQAGDVDGYAQFRRQAIAQFGGTSDRTTAEWIAKDCLILPLEGPELTALAQMAEMAVSDTQVVPASHIPWIRCTKGLAEFRQGHYSSAIGWLKQASPDDVKGQNEQRFVEAHSVLAMSNFRMNDLITARKEFARSKLVFENGPKIDNDALFKGNGIGFADWIIAHALLKEADVLIEGDSPATLEEPRL